MNDFTQNCLRKKNKDNPNLLLNLEILIKIKIEYKNFNLNLISAHSWSERVEVTLDTLCCPLDAAVKSSTCPSNQ
jgi:hypothetical protein